MTMTRFANDESLLIQAQNGDSEAVELYLSAFVPFLNAIAKRFFNPCVILAGALSGRVYRTNACLAAV